MTPHNRWLSLRLLAHPQCSQFRRRLKLRQLEKKSRTRIDPKASDSSSFSAAYCWATSSLATCVATLTPIITNEFRAISDVGWYGVAYLLASCGTILIYGQVYSFFSMKEVFILSCFIFTIGAAVSATAPSSAVFIIGRAITGLGSAGVFAGGNIIVANTTSLKHRPIHQALSGGMECVALAFGPVVSGAISYNASWRFAFYVVIPIGAAMIVSVFFLVNHVQRPEHADLSRKEKIRRLDLVGFALYVPMTVCLTLGLQWAGIEYSWENWRIILLLVFATILLACFLLAEHRTGEASMFPLAMLRQRSIALACLYTFCNSGALFILSFYLPIYFQAVCGATTTSSGLMYLPTAIAFATGILVAGPVTSAIGYYTPIMVFGSILMAIGVGLITTFGPTISEGKWIGYQILYGAGVGLAFQQPYTAVQTVLDEARVAIALVTLSFTQEFGGIVALSIAQNVYVDQLARKLSTIPGLDVDDILDSGATGVLDRVPLHFRGQVLKIYNDVIVDVFYIALALVLVTLSGVFIEWRTVKEEKEKEKEDRTCSIDGDRSTLVGDEAE